ncbi:DUF2993 domain-containing protein [Oculatella sp. LEGE 06141]|nr:DUF2993 domain-containing protein [Oculatella sp. LEGE 06141]MBE9178987.1 DUF2993 domain-containing protein [Oculatella sp. LEGE 06141]
MEPTAAPSTSHAHDETAAQSPEPTPPEEASRRSRIISTVLSPAVRLWLRSQVEQVEALEFRIEGGDRQLLSGHIPQVIISASKAVYQGLHLSQVQMVGRNIRVNLGQMLRGKPLRLLAVVPIRGEVVIQQADLNASLHAPMLATALAEFLAELLRSQLSPGLSESSEPQKLTLQNPSVTIGNHRITLVADLLTASGRLIPVAIRTGMQVMNGNLLCLEHPQWLPHPRAKRGLPLNDLHGFQVDLGSDVDLEELSLEDERIICRGGINVIPVTP